MPFGAEQAKRERQEKLEAQAKKLRKWFKSRKGRRQHLMARALGVSDYAVHAWCNAERAASGLFPEAIEEYTDGFVKAEGWPRRIPGPVGVSK